MLKMKKRSLLVVLAFVMVLALSCSAWAAVGVRAPGTTVPMSQDIVTTEDSDYGANATNGGVITNDQFNITTSGVQAHGILARASATAPSPSKVDMSGDIAIVTSGKQAYGAWIREACRLDLVGNITTSGEQAYGLQLDSEATAEITGDITTQGYKSDGLEVANATLVMTGNVKTAGDEALGIRAQNSADITLTGNIETAGNLADGVRADASNVAVTGNVTVNGTNSYGLSGKNASTIEMSEGTLTVADESSFGIKLEDDSEANLTNVTVDAANLLATTTTGTLNAEGSTLVGDVLHGGAGADAGSLEINLTDSTLEGAVLVSPGVGALEGGQVDITLENSDWLVTGDSNTNGTLTGDGNSSVDTSKAPEGTTVVVDEIVGEIDFNLKPGDTLGVTNSSGNNSFESSDPDVLEVVQNPDGSWSIVSKGEGDADLTYTYKDPVTGETKTVTTGVSSEYADGQSKPDTETPTGTSSKHSSSGCNAGFGALFAVLGLALIQKRK